MAIARAAAHSQKLERTQLPLNRGMDIENVVHLHNGVLLSFKRNEPCEKEQKGF